jgi:hypothetical protein
MRSQNLIGCRYSLSERVVIYTIVLHPFAQPVDTAGEQVDEVHRFNFKVRARAIFTPDD